MPGKQRPGHLNAKEGTASLHLPEFMGHIGCEQNHLPHLRAEGLLKGNDLQRILQNPEHFPIRMEMRRPVFYGIQKQAYTRNFPAANDFQFFHNGSLLHLYALIIESLLPGVKACPVPALRRSNECFPYNFS